MFVLSLYVYWGSYDWQLFCFNICFVVVRHLFFLCHWMSNKPTRDGPPDVKVTATYYGSVDGKQWVARRPYVY